jgi:LPXTG-site transpeptidase (sortase) family protein
MRDFNSGKYKHLIIGALLAGSFALAGFVLLNYQYFSKQAIYIIRGGSNRPSPTPTSADVSQQEKLEPNQLYIPSLDIRTPIQYVDQVDEAAFQTALQNGVVHYPGTADIGQPGNPYIFGHSSDFPTSPGGYKTVFALLPRIQNGAEIVVSGKDGTNYTYAVVDQFVAEKTDLHLLDQGEYKEKLITIQTSYPLGTALKRYIVKAKLKE